MINLDYIQVKDQLTYLNIILLLIDNFLFIDLYMICISFKNNFKLN